MKNCDSFMDNTNLKKVILNAAKNPEGDRGTCEANFVWILRFAQNDSTTSAVYTIGQVF